MLLEARDIRKHFASRGQPEVRAVDDVSLSVTSGENVGLVGESGCGKTTLAKIIMGLLTPDSGTLQFEGQTVRGDRERERAFRRRVRMVFQDPFASLDPRYSVRSILREALCLEPPLPSSAEAQKMHEVLSAVGLSPEVLMRYPHEFSGGERQRIAIARALMTGPALVIFDEAVSSLDVLIQQEILALLEELQPKFHMTYLFISHNLRVVKKISRKISVMYRGKIVEHGSPSQIFEDPRHPYTRRLLSAALAYRAEDGGQPALPSGSSWQDVGNGHWILM